VGGSVLDGEGAAEQAAASRMRSRQARIDLWNRLAFMDIPPVEGDNFYSIIA